MRRKSGSKKTTPKSDSPKPARRSRRLNRSPSVEKKEVEIEPIENVSDNNVENVEEVIVKPEIKAEIKAEIAENNVNVNVIENKDIVIEEKDPLGDDDRIEDEDKGKSKGIVNKDEDDEPVSREVKAEIESDNVQGTTQSPSNDNSMIIENDEKRNDVQMNNESLREIETVREIRADPEEAQEFHSEYNEKPVKIKNIEAPEITDLSNSNDRDEVENAKENQREAVETEEKSSEEDTRDAKDAEVKVEDAKMSVEKSVEPAEKSVEIIAKPSTPALDPNDGEGNESLERPRGASPTATGRFLDESPSSKINRSSCFNTQKSTASRSRQPIHWTTTSWIRHLPPSYRVNMPYMRTTLPKVELLKEEEVSAEVSPELPKERRRSEGGESIRRSLSEDATSADERQSNKNIIAMNRRISIVEDSKSGPPLSPAKNPVSEVLFITNLVRPFTVKQLKELLARTGSIVEGSDGFWTDNIKSKCYVRYLNVEDAEATRNALHGIYWPPGNGRQLVIDYGTVEDMEKAMNPPPPVPPVKVPEKENREPEKSVERFTEEDEEEHHKRRRRSSAKDEFDVGKESENHSRERVRKHSRRSYTPEDMGRAPKIQKKEEPAPQKLMDDLFLKTKASPSIYWQPLSPEEIATKQKQRLDRMEEHKRRIEDRERRMRGPRRPPFRRR